MAIGSSNYIISQDPNKFGGQQADYLKKSEEAIGQAISSIQEAKQSHQDLQQLFFKILHVFASIRHEIAVAHGTRDAHSFGRRRLDCVSDVAHTALVKPYTQFNTRMVRTFEKILQETIPVQGKPSKMTHSIQDAYGGRACSLHIEYLTPKELNERQWNRNHHSDLPKIVEKLPRIDCEAVKTVDENNFPPSDEEQKILDNLKNWNLTLKKQHPHVYVQGKMGFILPAVYNSFPSPKVFFTPEGKPDYYEGNPDYFKSLYLLAKVRIAIDNKMYALSEYFTWTYQDHETDPVARIKRSTIAIIHQDQFLVEDTLKEIAKLFEKAVLWEKTKESLKELKDYVGLIRYLFAHAMPFLRGSASIGEWMEKSLYKIHGYQCAHNPETLGDMEALIAPMWSTFRSQKYEKTFTLT